MVVISITAAASRKHDGLPVESVRWVAKHQCLPGLLHPVSTTSAGLDVLPASRSRFAAKTMLKPVPATSPNAASYKGDQ